MKNKDTILNVFAAFVTLFVTAVCYTPISYNRDGNTIKSKTIGLLAIGALHRIRKGMKRYEKVQKSVVCIIGCLDGDEHDVYHCVCGR